MRIGVPSEIKIDEHRVALTPAGVRDLVDRGHTVLVQSGAGEGSAIADADYEAQGAITLPDADDLDATVRAIRKNGAAQTETRIVLRSTPFAQRLD